jgi:hypothetical protein
MKKIGALAIASIMLASSLVITPILSEVKGTAAEKPDLEGVKITMSDYNLRWTGQTVDITVKIRNNGKAIPYTTFWVRLYIDETKHINSWEVQGIGGNGAIKFLHTQEQIVESLGGHTLDAYIDEEGRVDESDETNNDVHCNFKVTITGNAYPNSCVNQISLYWQSLTPFTITATASDEDGYVESVELFYRYSTDNSTWGDWTSFGVDNEAPWSWSFNAPNGDGYYEFYSIATDDAGSVEDSPETADAIAGVNQ